MILTNSLILILFYIFVQGVLGLALIYSAFSPLLEKSSDHSSRKDVEWSALQWKEFQSIVLRTTKIAERE